MGRPSRPLAERFEKKYIPEPNSGCWLWTGTTNKKGYGHIVRDATFAPTGAHRISWELHRGPIPDGMCVLHRCDNPPCVNPDHLFLGTMQDNTLDSVKKGRWNKPKGRAQYLAKLTDEKVREIRASVLNNCELAKLYGVNPGCIWQVRARQTWKHVI